MILLIVLVFAVVGGMAYIRLAPTDPERWHTDPLAAEPGAGAFVVKPEGGDTSGPLIAAAPAEALAQLHAVAMATPRTRVVAGSLDEGRITYETRSLVMGFPDYTTVTALPDGDGARYAIFARLRFGNSDLGVNRARVEGWLEQLAPGDNGS